MSYWERQRGKLNHDLLKNQIIPSLDRLRRIVDGQISGSGVLEDARTHLLYVWSEFHPAMCALLHTDREGLGPEKWFLEPPLSRLCERDVNWMKGLVSAHCSEAILLGKERVWMDLETLDQDLKQLAQELTPDVSAGLSRRLIAVRKKMSILSDCLSALSSNNGLLGLLSIPAKNGKRSEA